MIRTLVIVFIFFIAFALHSKGQSALIVKKVVEERLFMEKFEKNYEEVYLKDGKKLYTLKYKDNEPGKIFTYYYGERGGIKEMFSFDSNSYPDFDGLEAIKKKGNYMLTEAGHCSCWNDYIPDYHNAVWVSDKILICYEYKPYWFSSFNVTTIEFY